MEFVEKYWYIILGVLAVGFLFLRQNSGAGSLQQVSGGSADTVALAQLASQEREADENRKFGLVNTLLNYQLSDKQVNQQIDLANIASKAQIEAARNQYLLASLQANLEQTQYAQQYALQNYALQSAYNQQRRNDWLGAISTGIQTLAPRFFGNATTGGRLNIPSTPPTFPVGGWTWPF